jgi:hypothetical protein
MMLFYSRRGYKKHLVLLGGKTDGWRSQRVSREMGIASDDKS